MKELANSDHGIGSKAQAAILQRQLRSGELRRGGSYVFDPNSGKFRSMTERELVMSNARAQLAEVESSAGSDWRIDLLRRRLRLVGRGL